MYRRSYLLNIGFMLRGLIIYGAIGSNHVNTLCSTRMYKARLVKYGFSKKAVSADWQALAVLHKQRKDSARHATESCVHGRRKTCVDLRKYIKSKAMSEDDFIKLVEVGAVIPPHIRCYTPESTGRRTTIGSDDSGIGLSPAYEASPIRPTDLLDPYSNVSPSEHQNPGSLQGLRSSNCKLKYRRRCGKR